jgi:hypothetical protein
MPWSCFASFLYSSEMADVLRPMWAVRADLPAAATYSTAHSIRAMTQVGQITRGLNRGTRSRNAISGVKR